MTLQFYKSREVSTPTRGTVNSAGIDFYIPKFTKQYLMDIKQRNNDNVYFSNDEILVYPNESIVIPSGIFVKFDDKHALVAFNKSGVAVKDGLTVGACVIDSDYQGELDFHLINETNEIVRLTENKKIIQLLMLPIILCDLQEISSKDELYTHVTERGIGGFGSTNK